MSENTDSESAAPIKTFARRYAQAILEVLKIPAAFLFAFVGTVFVMWPVFASLYINYGVGLTEVFNGSEFPAFTWDVAVTVFGPMAIWIVFGLTAIWAAAEVVFDE